MQLSQFLITFKIELDPDYYFSAFTSKLEYLSSLGVKTIVISNILKVSDESSDGNDEFKNVAPSYGTLADLKSLIIAAKDKGKVHTKLTKILNMGFITEKIISINNPAYFLLQRPLRDWFQEPVNQAQLKDLSCKSKCIVM